MALSVPESGGCPGHPVAATLRWAAGGAYPQATRQVGHEEILAAAACHKVTRRLLQRLEAESPAWASSELVCGLEAQLSADDEQWDSHLEQVVELIDLTQGSGQRFLLLRGLVAYAVTGDDTMKRAVGDIDLLAADPEALTELLLDNGYARLKLQQSRHEQACVYKSDSYVEIVRYVPIVREPASRNEASTVTPALAAWASFVPLGEGEISFVDIAEMTRSFTMPNRATVTVPNVTLAALLTAAHIYHEYARLSVPRRQATVRLSDILELERLRTDPEFDEALFCGLTSRYDAATSVRFCNDLAAALLGSTTPETREATAPFALFPPDFAVAPALAHRAEDLLVRCHESRCAS